MRSFKGSMRKNSLLRCTGCAGAVILLAAPIGTISALGGDTNAVMRVEQDWVLDVNEPASASSSPQFHTVMSPYGTLDGLYFQVTWNYQELPEAIEGGLQLQVWGGQEDFASRNAGEGHLSNDAERVTWTSTLMTDNMHVTFGIESGYSQSWGAFGGESMRVRTARPLANLAAYSTDVTTANSWVTFGSNRVNRLVLKEVRTYNAEGTLLSRDTQERVIYQSDGNNN